MTPARVAKIATARVRIAAALAEHRAPPVADPAHDLTPEEVEVLRSMLGRACVALPSPPTRLHELGLVRPVSVRGGDDARKLGLPVRRQFRDDAQHLAERFEFGDASGEGLRRAGFARKVVL